MQPSDVTMWGRDYSAREFSDADFKRYERENPNERPVQWIDRYIGYPGNPKCISHYPGMYQHHWSAGRPVSLFHQIGYDDMGGGYDRGRQHASTALADARRVGWNGESHITACMDRFYAKAGHATLNAGQLSEYMRGFRSVLGDRTGFYGFYDSMRDAINGGWASFYVQCGARSAHVSGIHAWQENNYQPRIFGTPTDILELYASRQYAFGGRASGGGGGAGTSITNQENDMFFVGVLNAPKADGSFNGWSSSERFLVHGNSLTGGFTDADIKAARADAANGPIPLFGVTNAVFQDMRMKGELPRLTLEALLQVSAKLDSLSVGGDPAAFAKAVAPLMPKAPTSIENAQATVAELKKEGN